MHWIACVVAVIFHLCSKSIARSRALKPSCQCDALLPVTRTPKLPVSAADSYVLPFQTTSRPICCHGVSFKIFTIDPLSVYIGIGVPVWIVRNVPMFMSCHKLLQYLCLCWFNVKCWFVICPKSQSDSKFNLVVHCPGMPWIHMLSLPSSASSSSSSTQSTTSSMPLETEGVYFTAYTETQPDMKTQMTFLLTSYPWYPSLTIEIYLFWPGCVHFSVQI